MICRLKPVEIEKLLPEEYRDLDAPPHLSITEKAPHLKTSPDDVDYEV